MTAQPIRVDPDAGIPDLVRRLGDDGKRLISNEIQLAKLETTESVHRAGVGAAWMGVAFAVGVITLVALTIFLITAIGRVASGHMWVGSLIVGAAELVLSLMLLKRGVKALAAPSYTLPETRAALREIVRRG
jgi:hypothetical protein